MYTGLQHETCSEAQLMYTGFQHETCSEAQLMYTGFSTWDVFWGTADVYRVAVRLLWCGSADSSVDRHHIHCHKCQFLSAVDSAFRLQVYDRSSSWMLFFICGNQSGTESSFSFPSVSSVFPSQHHFTIAPCSFICHQHYKIFKISIVIKQNVFRCLSLYRV